MAYPRIPSLFLLALVLCLFGCGKTTEETGPNQENSEEAGTSFAGLRLLVIDDGELAAAARNFWQLRGEGKAEVREISSDQWSNEKLEDADAVIFPSGMLGTLAAGGSILPVPEEVLGSDSLAQRDVYPLLRWQETQWGEETLALTFGSPQLLLCYRKDLFEKWNLAPPTTWEEYQSVAERVAQETNHPPVEPLAPGWAGQILLARAAAYARHRSQYSALFDFRTMQPLIAEPPFVRALDELAKANQGQAEPRSTPADAWRQLAAGNCAMAITWPGKHEDEAKSIENAPFGFALLPGSGQVYHARLKVWESRKEEDASFVPLLGVSGRLGGVTRNSRRPRDAFALLVWLCGKENSESISSASNSTTLYRLSQSGTSWVPPELDAASAKEYAAVVEEACSQPVWLFSPRLPGRHEYLSTLDEAVFSVLAGEKSTTEALQEAARKWDAITEKLGRGTQQQAYQKSLGLDL